MEADSEEVLFGEAQGEEYEEVVWGERGNVGNVCKDAGYLREIGRHDCWMILEIHPQRFRFKNWSATTGL